MYKKIDALLKNHRQNLSNPSRRFLINESIETGSCFPLKTGTLATWTEIASTGRSPKDTVTVRTKENEKFLDWESSYNNPIDPETFAMILDDALNILKNKTRIYTVDRFIGSDPLYTLPVRTVSDNPLTLLFADNMFRNNQNPDKSVLKDKAFNLLVCPLDKLDPLKYRGRLRVNPETGETTDMVIAIDYENSVGVVIGSSYMGTVKKLMFTIMNYYTIFNNILPLHCSANEGTAGKTALFLGLSGTGKTTLSTSPDRKLIGDDEHGWSENGIANFENGCYAKLINLNKDKEPDIYKACFAGKNSHEYGAIVENVMVYPDRSFDLSDARLTENSRGSYPLSFIDNIKETGMGNSPSSIIFLTADANGVLPPISRLNIEQAKFWFLMGYTSKLAGTETGIVQPVSTFSRFFGAPFMPAKPAYYLELFEKKLNEFDTEVFLVNTGWAGGSYGTGKRIDLRNTRAMIKSALNGELRTCKTDFDPIFKLNIVPSVPGVSDTSLFIPSSYWKDKTSYKMKAENLAHEFRDYYEKVFAGQKIFNAIEDVCPGY